jgi:hypothetical protein
MAKGALPGESKGVVWPDGRRWHRGMSRAASDRQGEGEGEGEGIVPPNRREAGTPCCDTP